MGRCSTPAKRLNGSSRRSSSSARAGTPLEHRPSGFRIRTAPRRRSHPPGAAGDAVTVPKQRHLRVGDDLEDDDVVVVRGGELDADVLRADAQRYYAIYAEFGISVFAARGITVDELAQQPPLVRFEVLTLVQVGVLRAAAFRLEPTGRNPRHFTVAFDDLEKGVARLTTCEHQGDQPVP